ncbi:MAG: aminodeoxychorismate/anthranilate synthase component II [Austwickia sp.]|nr:aminodeoxychorismate/anthranilate synthase component II [Actinomycetota bacterium]MCB1252328.1 aminodeoxychorismate/anthranilate synthase component II [Austwickia sp.]MCO5309564.1 aminodeoxychorismate/anthranilate synthase component II [Austwickia sp.]
MTRILVVDNYDSFVYTIVGYLQQLGADCEVRRNDTIAAAEATAYDGVLVSPGPGVPESAGVSVEMIRRCGAAGVPMFGVCLGHQALAVAYGATVGRAPELVHGKTSRVLHEGTGVFAGLPSPLTATRYHSLAIVETTLPPELVVTARTESGVIMGVSHREAPLHGVQFHPESVLTQGGHRMLANWLVHCGLPDAVRRAEPLSPLVGAAAGHAAALLRG